MGFLPLVEYQWGEAHHAGTTVRAERSAGAGVVGVTCLDRTVAYTRR